MLTKILRLLSSSKRPEPLWSSIPTAIPSNPSPENIDQLISTYKSLYSKSQQFYPEHIWKSDQRLLSSLNSLNSHLSSVSPNSINALIKVLSLFSLPSHAIWSTLSTLFINNSVHELDPKDLPCIIKGFSVSLPKNEQLWDLLSEKMLEYLKSSKIDVEDLVTAYSGFCRSNRGSEELLNILENRIILNLTELKGPQYIDLYISLSSQVSEDSKLGVLFLTKSLQRLDECGLDDLIRLHMIIFFTREKYELARMVENSILKGVEGISLKQLATVIYKYNSPNFKELKSFSEFPSTLINRYLENREELIRKVNNKNLQAVYEIKVLSTAIRLGVKLPDHFVRMVYKDILRNNLQFGNKVQLRHSFLVIQSYMGLIN